LSGPQIIKQETQTTTVELTVVGDLDWHGRIGEEQARWNCDRR
jgi:hypothetical protein